MDKFTFKRASGVLCSVSSLPSEFGIGCFSKDADAFTDLVADMGFSWWQILPITTIGWGNSPYSGLSSFAGNALYVSPSELYSEGLLSADELNSARYHGEPYSVDYDFARANSSRVLRLAYSRVNDVVRSEIESFRRANSDWVEDYALYMALTLVHGSDWSKWPSALAHRDPSALKEASRTYADDIGFYLFEQYEFFRQWNALKQRVNKKGVRIIGDLPFYVATNSVDVWANQSAFALDENLCPKAIAGVPPDAFSATGQVWGNVIYDFKAQRKDNFGWWRSRISHCLKMYDALRLDHFRAFYNYFSIPPQDAHTAENGHWEYAPADELIDLFIKDNPDAKFIAEDLGIIDDECRRFIESTGIPTMRVFQFGFDGTPSCNIPYNYDKNTVCYSGTHDNNTLLGWLYDLNEGARNYALKYCGFEGAGWGAGGASCKSTKAIIRTLIMSPSVLAVFPVQDMLGYGGDTRMNVPGVAEGNWRFRLPFEQMMSVDRNFFLDMNNSYGRGR